MEENALFVIKKQPKDIKEKHVATAVKQLSPAQLEQFLLLRDSSGHPYTHLLDALKNNWFFFRPLAGHREGTPTESGTGLYPIQSRFNNGCAPNCWVTWSDSGVVQTFATKDIGAGEELTICYIELMTFLPLVSRSQCLRFRCKCAVCSENFKTPGGHLSDLRRTLLRGVVRIRLGYDPVGHLPIVQPLVITGSALKNASKSHKIPHSLRFICLILIACLEEAEGLLNQFQEEAHMHSVKNEANLFRTMSNCWIAQTVVVQTNWYEKLHLAMRLYGKADLADDEITASLRQNGYT